MPKILLVEDNEMNRDMLSRRLQRKGYEIGVAVDGAEGVAMALAGAGADPDGRAAGDRRLEATADPRGRDRPRVPIIAPPPTPCPETVRRRWPAARYDTAGRADRLLERSRPSCRERMNGLTSAEAVGELRHELRTPLNLIIGYCEMLLEDATEPSQRAGLERALRAGRDILDRVTSALPSSRSEVTGPEIAALFTSLRAPQEEVQAATTGLLGAKPDDPQWERDIRRIRAAAERLLTVEVPTRRMTGAATGSFDAPTTELPAAGPPVTPADILVVDDNEDNRAVLERRLGRQGHRVTSATGGRAALELARRDRFDLVLLDVLMPDLDGLAVLEQLKADPATRDIPVIMISALDDVASVVRCIERGAEDHLPKPFDPVLLRARISACLEKKRLRDVELEYLRE
jgi:CheY-like chemotaxis protein